MLIGIVNNLKRFKKINVIHKTNLVNRIISLVMGKRYNLRIIIVIIILKTPMFKESNKYMYQLNKMDQKLYIKILIR